MEYVIAIMVLGAVIWILTTGNKNKKVFPRGGMVDAELCDRLL